MQNNSESTLVFVAGRKDWSSVHFGWEDKEASFKMNALLAGSLCLGNHATGPVFRPAL